jgi:hypothetical protein
VGVDLPSIGVVTPLDLSLPEVVEAGGDVVLLAAGGFGVFVFFFSLAAALAACFSFSLATIAAWVRRSKYMLNELSELVICCLNFDDIVV